MKGRARGQRTAALERSRQEELRRRAGEERMRIARDLHDVVAHNISVINVQANTALHLMDRQPDRARSALAAINEVSRQALVELRAVLGVLRAVDENGPRAPAPGLARLGDLADTAAGRPPARRRLLGPGAAAAARTCAAAATARTCAGLGRPVIRVALADDQELVRAGFAALLDAEDDIDVIGEAADGEHAVLLAERCAPDVLLMDIRMPGVDGIVATRRIAARPDLGSVHVVILTTFELDEYVFEGLRAGAAGFLVKDTDAAELIRAVRVVARGEAILSPAVTRRLIAEFALRTRSPRRLPHLDELTPREREVLALIATGLSNDEISRKIYVSPATVKTHASRAMTKPGARDRAQLVVFAYQAGLIRPG